jgi:hypothetical protein
MEMPEEMVTPSLLADELGITESPSLSQSFVRGTLWNFGTLWGLPLSTNSSIETNILPVASTSQIRITSFKNVLPIGHPAATCAISIFKGVAVDCASFMIDAGEYCCSHLS